MKLFIYSLQCPVCGEALVLDPDTAEQDFDDYVAVHNPHLSEQEFILVIEHPIGDGVMN
jgi:hypothetical protein